MIVHVATNNRHKLLELQALFPSLTLRTPADAGLNNFDVIEDADSFAGNAWLKADALWHSLRRPVLADDSGLCVDALDGRPGIMSARYGSDGGPELAPAERNRLLLAEMATQSRRSCRFVCCLCLIVGPQRVFSVQETCDGELLGAPQGSGGFGYDPLVWLPDLGKSVAELSDGQKNQVSHRGRAAQRLNALLADLRD
ncbi:MAG: hypothetical protein A2087_01245 [Spirochaetes bacterium GWD1_61_31]|nr:MAG: hypothetical protein A2Y37_14530 [Spirochaetes bacterium GWB1_60_80]OHD32568.1 MAG: hypothetical protein A2004_06095 [Spirochaetes bacterium GWC1_61_12]OHD39804.1 MAG: hypothetical protein A2087_01245 [Spirochaetes bacterium GWD1_61_31]OHD44561.1 MAG: hypothetical protein A2Y35_05370 [Spirochaetes bacterium GWE1_60_18]OHD58651.1 MAG: hypothetical protein A2Y32_03245 [Spirochaetes bacterium GWF1_60_12]HAP43218.1 non-canonical purine NTP pyrophosphatase [Spirochaetaceae bacterium]